MPINNKCVLFSVTCLFSLTAASPPAQPVSDRLEGLRNADVRLASVFYRLAVANDELCTQRGALTGLVLHSRDEYDEAIRAAAEQHFDFESAIGVEGIVPGSPAARAGIGADDSVVAIDGAATSQDESRRQALAALDRAGADGQLTLRLRRDGHERSVTLRPVEGCAAHTEVAVSDDLNAKTDGDTIQVDSALINLVGNDDQALAAIVGHELAHVVLNHPARLTAAHVDRGLFKGFGRSARLFKQTENEADRLSVVLMANAGYDPRAAVRYWLSYGPQLNDGGGLGSTHLSWRKRAALIGDEVNRIAQYKQRPIVPAWIAHRDQPLR